MKRFMDWGPGHHGGAITDSIGAVALATGAVFALDSVAPATGLGVVYLLAVLFVAIRRGEIPALATAVLSVLALNYFFIEPRHRLTISDSENVVALVVFLIAAIVVGRLAAIARQRASEAEERASEAAAREQEARVLAAAASSVLEAAELSAQVEAARRADIAKTALLHAISHDLRSPLTAITTAAAGLRGDISAADRESLHEVIDGESARLARLVDDLLDLSRIQAGAANPR